MDKLYATFEKLSVAVPSRNMPMEGHPQPQTAREGAGVRDKLPPLAASGQAYVPPLVPPAFPPPPGSRRRPALPAFQPHQRRGVPFFAGVLPSQNSAPEEEMGEERKHVDDDKQESSKTALRAPSVDSQASTTISSAGQSRSPSVPPKRESESLRSSGTAQGLGSTCVRRGQQNAS